MDIKSAINILKESQGGHSYDIYVPSLDQEISFKPLKIGQLKSLNKFASGDDNNFYTSLSSLIVELSDNKIDLTKINEIDRTLILIGIKKNNTTTCEKIKITCSDCKKDYTHDLNIENYDDMDTLETKVSHITGTTKIENLTIKYDIGLPSVSEQIAFKDYITQRKRKRHSAETKKVKQMLYMSDDEKNKYVEECVANEEKMITDNPGFIFIRNIFFNDDKIELSSVDIQNRVDLYDQLPSSIKGEISDKIIINYNETLSNFLKYSVTCPHCKSVCTEEVPITSFFII